MEDAAMDKLQSNFDVNNPNPLQSSPTSMSIQTFSSDGDVVSSTPIPILPEEPKKDYKALAESHVYELLSENGAIRELNVDVHMIDDHDGTGKATFNIGKDVKKRRFEIPITIREGKVKMGKAIDLDTDKPVETLKIFEAPD